MPVGPSRSAALVGQQRCYAKEEEGWEKSGFDKQEGLFPV